MKYSKILYSRMNYQNIWLPRAKGTMITRTSSWSMSRPTSWNLTWDSTWQKSTSSNPMSQPKPMKWIQSGRFKAIFPTKGISHSCMPTCWFYITRTPQSYQSKLISAWNSSMLLLLKHTLLLPIWDQLISINNPLSTRHKSGRSSRHLLPTRSYRRC